MTSPDQPRTEQPRSEPNSTEAEDPAATSDGEAGTPAGTVTDPLIGRVIDDRYRIVSLVDHGGMASVYRAYDQRLERNVAVKIIHPHLAGSSLLMTRFSREARSAAKVSHPNIVPVYDQGIFEGRSYLVMELVPGTNLRTVLNSQGPLPVGMALSFTEQILEGIRAAHEANLVHRDLKPENVLVTPQGVLKIVDFGLVRAKTDESLTVPDSLIGTMAYLAPESALPGQVDERADLYSAGLMLYEMLTGRLPWPEVTPTQVALTHVNQDVPAPSSVATWLPPQIDQLVASLSARDSSQRISSAKDALDSIEKARSETDSQLLARRAEKIDLHSPAEAATQELNPSQRPHETLLLPIKPQVVQTVGSDGQAVPSGKKKKKQAAPLPLLILVAVLAIAGLPAGTWWWMQYGPGSYLVIPEVALMGQVQAETKLNSNRITYSLTQDTSDEIPSGYAIGTSPGGGTRIHKNDTIELVISDGPLLVTVPDVTGLNQADASAALNEASLQVGEVTETWSDTVAAGKVVTTFPLPDREVRADSEVSLQVSKGKRPVDIPSVVGMRSEEAAATISAAGLTPQITRETSTDQPEGIVLSQQPEAGQGTAPAGSTVQLVVSLGPQVLPVPDVRGMSQEKAQETLAEAGFNLEVGRGFSVFSIVVTQDPAPGTELEAGSKVTVTLW